VTSPAPLTEAEQAVVDVLAGDSACTWHVGCDVEDCYGPRARVIVAAVRPSIYDEVADRIRQHVPESERPRVGDDAVFMWGFAVRVVRRWAAALRTTTSEKEN
jgi:hypothetical protein